MAAQKQEKKLSAKYFSAFLNAYYPQYPSIKSLNPLNS